MKKTINNLKIIYKYGKEYKNSLIYETIGSLIGIAINIAIPILTAKQVVYLTDNIWQQLIIMTLVVLIVNIIGALKTVLIRKNTQKFAVGVTEKMQREIGKEILKISQSDIDNHSTGTFVARMTSDVNNLGYMFTIGYGRLVGIVSSIGTFIAVFIINKIVFTYFVLIAICLTTFHLIKSRRFNQKDKEKRILDDKASSLTVELIRGSRDIKMLNAKKSFMKALQSNIYARNKKHIEMRNVEIKYNLIIDSLIAVFEFFLILLFIVLIKSKTLSVAMAIALYSYRYRVMSNFMENISLLLEESYAFNLSFERVFSLLTNYFQKENFGDKHLKRIKGNFEFKDVSFAYQDGLPVLNNLNFKVDANTTVGFVGKSGTGKTTIFSLICKLYDINSGEILIDGQNIKELDEESIRGNITVISQSPYIFNMSIVDNMKLVKDDVTLSEIKDACKLACLDEFIESLPDKYNTVVGEGGVTLSGGQRQRLAIARALIQKTEIILFDEATSALDNETQIKIQKAIENLKKNYTIMIIAHRLSTIINCDKIMIIDKGKIVGEGTHEELLKNNKNYKKLCKTELLKQ